MAMTVGDSKGDALADLNVTPLIDVLLVLLIIFMVITPLTPKGLDAFAPQPNPKPDSVVPTRTIVVSIDAGRNIEINQQPVLISQLGQRLEDIFKTRNERAIFVTGDPGLPFSEVATVIEVAKSAGIDKIGLMPGVAVAPKTP